MHRDIKSQGNGFTLEWQGRLYLLSTEEQCINLRDAIEMHSIPDEDLAQFLSMEAPFDA